MVCSLNLSVSLSSGAICFVLLGGATSLFFLRHAGAICPFCGRCPAKRQSSEVHSGTM